MVRAMEGTPTLSPGLILLTGATGYVGGRLLGALERTGHRVRCLVRDPDRIAARLGVGTEVVRADAVSGEGLAEALRGVDTAYYLIHSMGCRRGFEETDRQAALNFGSAARSAGVKRIIYLGGLAQDGPNLSPHLRSRLEVGRVLRQSGVPVTELRASIVIGSGSLSFEMIRAIVEHLPVLVTPQWVSIKAQPIGIDDLLAYLVQAASIDVAPDAVFEIGGSDRSSYGDLMREYARQRGLRRLMIRVPVLSPRLSSYWLGLVTPLYARIGRKLIDSIRNASVVQDESASQVFSVRPISTRDAIRRALENEEREFAETRWSDALSVLDDASEKGFGGVRVGQRLIDSRSTWVAAAPAQAFAPIRSIGGQNGWYAHDWLWWLRGVLDLLVGGAGMRRGRRHPTRVAVGDTIDCWRVVGFEPDRSLRLLAEMKLPGRAWLEYEVQAEGSGSRIRQTAIFHPSGLAGLAYWYSIYILHGLVFGGMLAGIRERAARGRGPGSVS
jgi:uncharacterized protein YbjT (DUF2867 family)